MTLREEIGVRQDPEFDLALPPGWSRRAVDEQTLESLLADVRARCMRNHQPQLFGELRAYLQRAFADMERAGVFAYFAPADSEPDTLTIPASINASIRRAEPGATLDDLVRVLIRQHGATPLLGDRRTVRFETEKSVRMGSNTVIAHSLTYLTPVPGSKRRRALALVAGFGRTVDTDPEAANLEATRALFDACVSTLRWEPPAPAPADAGRG